MTAVGIAAHSMSSCHAREKYTSMLLAHLGKLRQWNREVRREQGQERNLMNWLSRLPFESNGHPALKKVSFSQGDCPVHCGMLSSIPDRCLLDGLALLPTAVTVNSVSRYCYMSFGKATVTPVCKPWDSRITEPRCWQDLGRACRVGCS